MQSTVLDAGDTQVNRTTGPLTSPAHCKSFFKKSGVKNVSNLTLRQLHKQLVTNRHGDAMRLGLFLFPF